MHYKISYNNPHEQFIDVEYTVDTKKRKLINIQLPSWRPGRYELGNFAKNVRCFVAFDEAGNVLKNKKISKDCWEISPEESKSITVKYQYYAAELNAGSTFLNHQQIYVNPVNCCMYDVENIDAELMLDLVVPNTYTLANSLNVIEEKETEDFHKIINLTAKNFHELADSPFIASPTIKREYFVIDGIEFNLWFQGECRPVFSKLISDFFIFINEQLTIFKSIETEVFHFMFQIVPYQFYHGVEHVNSTVIVLGPSYNLMKKEVYDELLGVSCHELFHHWNIKTIRPKEMLPYDYTKENYSTLGYVCEGVTTYYGDYVLYRSGVFSDDDYFNCFNVQLKKHCDNFGRFNYSLAESSFDTWLDGYNKGVPDRKVSIYTEGCIVAFITDINIRKHTKNQKCLDDVVRTLYNDYGKQNKGYTDKDYINIVNTTANADLNWIFNNHVYDSKIVIEPLKEALYYLGLELSIMPVKNIYEAVLGFKAVLESGKYVVSNIYPNSECEKKGLMLNDKIVSINGYEIKQDLNEWITYYSDDDISMEVINSGQLRQIICRNSKSIYYKNYAVIKQFDATAEQKENFKNWSGRYF